MRRIRQRPAWDGSTQLMLTSLLDVTALILIFVLRLLTSSPLTLPVHGIALPSTDQARPAIEATTIAITGDHILVNDRSVARVERGQVAAHAKRDGAGGYFITPLHAALVEAAALERRLAQRNPDRPFAGTALIVADRAVPFRLLGEVLYTAGQAEYGRFEFAVIAAR